jgi:23S rRNA G2445 N2-methylase RlmL
MCREWNMNGSGYFYLLAGPEETRELAALELLAMTGVQAQGPVGDGCCAVDVGGAGYIRFCADLVAAGESFEELVENTARAQCEFPGFHVRVWRTGGQVPYQDREIIIPLANSWGGHPNLDDPAVRLVVAAVPGRWRVGVLRSVWKRDWAGITRTVPYSAALSNQMARALVNLVAAPGDTLLDPCCGIGTVVVQARRRGVRAVGVEIVKKLAGQAAEFVRAQAPGGLIVIGDSRHLRGCCDAAVLDLPYGRASRADAGLYQDLLANLAGSVERAVVVAAEPLTALVERCGWEQRGLARAGSGHLVRHVHLLVRREPR